MLNDKNTKPALFVLLVIIVFLLGVGTWFDVTRSHAVTGGKLQKDSHWTADKSDNPVTAYKAAKNKEVTAIEQYAINYNKNDDSVNNYHVNGINEYERGVYKVTGSYTSDSDVPYTQTLMFLAGNAEPVSNKSVAKNFNLLTEEEADARDVAEGRTPYETYEETVAREQKYPVEQFDSRAKSELINATVLYLEKNYGLYQGNKYNYRLAVRANPNGWGGHVDVEWYLGNEYQGTMFLLFKATNIHDVTVHGFEPKWK